MDVLYKIAAGILAVILIWWKTKPTPEKIDTIEDGMKILEDGKVTPTELKEFCEEHK